MLIFNGYHFDVKRHGGNGRYEGNGLVINIDCYSIDVYCEQSYAFKIFRDIDTMYDDLQKCLIINIPYKHVMKNE